MKSELSVPIPDGAIPDGEILIVGFLDADGDRGIRYRTTPDMAYTHVIGMTMMVQHSMIVDSQGDQPFEDIPDDPAEGDD